MQKRQILVGTGVLAAFTAAITVGAVASAGPSAQKPNVHQLAAGRTITLFAKHTAITNFDLPPAGDSPGDQVWLSADDFDKLQGGKKIGHSFAYCTGYPRGSTSELLANACQVTFVDPKGQITSFGFSTAAKTDYLAVLGGTGQYQSARGQVARTFLSNAIRFDIELSQ